MKKFTMFLSAMMLAFLLVASPALACDGPDCVPDVTAEVNPNSLIDGTVVIAPGSSQWAGGAASAHALLSANAKATGMDSLERVKDYYVPGYWTGKPWRSRYVWGHWVYKTVLVPGEAEAYGETNLTMSSDVDISTNGPQFGGLSYTCVSSTSTLDINGFAWAKGTDGCPQTASIDLWGNLSATAWGNSYSWGPNGSFAQASGIGTTTVSFEGHESDFSTHGGWCSSNKAEVDFDSTINVNQKLFAASYVSPDGTTSANFAYVGGGSATLDLGSDATLFDWFAKDNIQLTGIQAQGGVQQSGMATNGNGAYAFGGSSAYFSGATGYVTQGQGGCGQPNQYANVGGYAVVAGYNNVSSSPGSLTVTSHQYGYATTGNTGRVSVISNGSIN